MITVLILMMLLLLDVDHDDHDDDKHDCEGVARDGGEEHSNDSDADVDVEDDDCSADHDDVDNGNDVNDRSRILNLESWGSRSLSWILNLDIPDRLDSIFFSRS